MSDTFYISRNTLWYMISPQLFFQKIGSLLTKGYFFIRPLYHFLGWFCCILLVMYDSPRSFLTLWLWRYVGNFWYCFRGVLQWEQLYYGFILKVCTYYYGEITHWYQRLTQAIQTRDTKKALLCIGQAMLIYLLLPNLSNYLRLPYYIVFFTCQLLLFLGNGTVFYIFCIKAAQWMILPTCLQFVGLIRMIPVVIMMYGLFELSHVTLIQSVIKPIKPIIKPLIEWIVQFSQCYQLVLGTFYENNQVFCKINAVYIQRFFLKQPLLGVNLPVIFYLAPLWEWLCLYMVILLWPKPKNTYWRGLWKALIWPITLRQLVMVLAIHFPAYWIYQVNGNPFIDALPPIWTTVSMGIDALLLLWCAYCISKVSIQRISTVYVGMLVYQCVLLMLDSYNASSVFTVGSSGSGYGGYVFGTQHYLTQLLSLPYISDYRFSWHTFVLLFVALASTYWFSSRRKYLSLPEH